VEAKRHGGRKKSGRRYKLRIIYPMGGLSGLHERIVTIFANSVPLDEE
jgi:hypothetical protein